MSEQDKKQTGIWLAVIVSAIILAALIIWSVVKKQPAEQAHSEHHGHEHPLFELPAESADDVNRPKMSLNNIIKVARTWGPAYQSWYGRPAPDFTLTDITDKQHRLSDYRGKNVLIVFWATWCGPCLMETPHLIALRNIIGEDKLAILAISSESPALVKQFVAQKKINYTVFSFSGILPTPFNLVRAIPCSFFIDTEGKVKLATEGLLSLGETKAILQAE